MVGTYGPQISMCVELEDMYSAKKMMSISSIFIMAQLGDVAINKLPVLSMSLCINYGWIQDSVDGL